MRPVPPTREEELALIQRAQAGETDAGWELVLRHDGWIRRMAWRLVGYRRGMEFDDALQIARLAMLRAIGTFDASKGCRLLTHATFRIRQAVAYQRQNDIACGAGPRGNPTGKKKPYPILRAVALDVDEVRSLLRTLQQRMFASPEEALRLRESAERFESVIGKLDPRERAIICRRFGDPPRRLSAIAAEFHLSKERIRQLEIRALEKLSYLVRGMNPPDLGDKRIRRLKSMGALTWQKLGKRAFMRRAS